MIRQGHAVLAHLSWGLFLLTLVVSGAEIFSSARVRIPVFILKSLQMHLQKVRYFLRPSGTASVEVGEMPNGGLWGH
jgi:hypothetical protein